MFLCPGYRTNHARSGYTVITRCAAGKTKKLPVDKRIINRRVENLTFWRLSHFAKCGSLPSKFPWRSGSSFLCGGPKDNKAGVVRGISRRYTLDRSSNTWTTVGARNCKQRIFKSVRPAEDI